MTLLRVVTIAIGVAAIAASAAAEKKSISCAKRQPNPPTPDKIAEAKPNDVMRFHFLNIGPGLCVLVECPGANEAVLADCGSSSSRFAMDSSEVFAYLDSYLAGKKAYSVVVSHGDKDHYSMLRPYSDRRIGVPLADGKKLLPVRALYGGDFSDYRCNKTDTEKAGNAFDGWGRADDDEPRGAVGSRSSARKRPLDESDDSEAAEDDDEEDDASAPKKTKTTDVIDVEDVGSADLDVRRRELKTGLFPAMQYFADDGVIDAKGGDRARLMPWFSCGTAKFYVLTAPRLPIKTNPRSIVLGIKYGTFEAVLPGDAEGETEKSATINSSDVRRFGSETVSGKIDLFASAHHGATTHGSNGKDWVRFADARVAIFSSGPESASAGRKPVMHHAHPKTEVVNKYVSYIETPADDCKHAFVQCGNKKVDCELQESRAEAVFSTAASGTIVVDAKEDASMVMRFPRKTSPDWAVVPDPADAKKNINLLDGQDKKCTFAAPPPPASP